MPRPSPTQPLPYDLRNRSFRGMDCAGWDFSGRDIRGCDFRNAKLNGANFSGAIAGKSQLQLNQEFLLTIAVIAIFLLTAAVIAVVAIKIEPLFEHGSAASFLLAVSILIAFYTSNNANRLGIKVSLVCAVAGTSLGLIKAYSQVKFPEIITFNILAILLFAFLIHLLSDRFKDLNNSIGTNFQSADLRYVDVSHASLRNCNFNRADTDYINWTEAKVDRSNINFSTTLMNLLITRKTPYINFTHLRSQRKIYRTKDVAYLDCGRYLTNQYLANVELQNANLSGVDLSQSNLQNANLSHADLSRVNVSGSDLRHAILTGACIQGWILNADTQFTGLICDYIYLNPDRSAQNRFPVSDSFLPGDFQKFIIELNPVFDLIEQLRTAIESPDCDLDDRHKKRAIEYLNKLTELAKDKPEDFLKSAKENLDDLADIADKGSKLATFAEKYLPTFMMAIGALRLWFGA